MSSSAARRIEQLNPKQVARFWSKVDRSGDCWLWTGGLDEKSGYGRFYLTAVASLAHRVAYTIGFGPFPDGVQVDHMCHNRSCVKPDHLRTVTPSQNVQNHTGARVSSKSGVRNVYWHRHRKKWAVTVRSGERRYFGGYFSDLEDAGRAAKALRLSVHTHNDLDRK